LTLEAEANPKLQLHSHFDERGLGFLALGMAKASQAPVAVIVTSGTAVANLLPAVAEAGLTGEKLVLLTADRPVELIDCGANQAINQSGIFSDHVTDSLLLPSPGESVPLGWLLSSLDHKMALQARHGGPLHINCPFPEPLYGEFTADIYQDYLAPVSRWQAGDMPYTRLSVAQDISAIATDAQRLSERKGLVVVGSVGLGEAQAVQKLAGQLGWPLLCDVQSGISSDWQHYDIWLQHPQAEQELAACNLILQVGGRIVSKRLNAFIRRQVSAGKTEYLQLQHRIERLNPDHLPLQQIACDIQVWCGQHVSQIQPAESRYANWGNHLVEYAEQVTNSAGRFDGLSELGLASAADTLCRSGNLFVGNSLIVRLLDMVAALNDKQVFTNRGASGIDGLVATAVGVQLVTGEPLTLLIGDTSLLYDLNSLALLRQCNCPVTIIVSNNDGGAIFGMLPVPEQQRQALYQMPHGLTFEYAAKQFGLNYLQPDSAGQMQQTVTAHMQGEGGTLLVELITVSEQVTQDIKSLVASLHAAQ
jgi:2-succinyl-5-enolpyruvyl-6-hydroxy-3-cyclohexene-1-carboxylate synthase